MRMMEKVLPPGVKYCSQECLKVNRGVFQTEQTYFLAVAYHARQIAKGQHCTPTLMSQPQRSAKSGEQLSFSREAIHEAKR
jgi:hypothetical protein